MCMFCAVLHIYKGVLYIAHTHTHTHTHSIACINEQIGEQESAMMYRNDY